ncbi:hypothetical protein GCM10010211_83740 [Streptomyces albospinus]|uniref:Uncharacterized protein n=1 Tax=Streptomyces albospinus TaxID=285515 RepID=A0ABQ2VPN8_9ACTN|nr:hypothetical protein [Streptomyces albospinus]GGV03724.1 hypothetical protein GCM10010211_83740 [Streptomyces albospinus]
MKGRHRGGDPRLDEWLERLWLLGTTAGLTLLAALTAQHDGKHTLAAPVSAPDTDPAP